MGTHTDLTTVKSAYDTDNSEPGVVVTAGATASESLLTFAADATIDLVLARTTATGLPGTNSSVSISTVVPFDLQDAVDAINGTGTPGAGTVEHGYLAEIVSTGAASGTIKLTQTPAGPAVATMTQTAITNLDPNNIGHSEKTVTTTDGVFTLDATDTTKGVFVPDNTNQTGTVSITLGGETLTIDGISDKGADTSGDATKIAAAINAGNHGYTAAAMTGADAGKVKITQPAAPTKDVDVNSAEKARESIVAIDSAIQTVNIQRSSLGAVSNRLSHTINNLTNISSNLSAAQGGIEDADFAHETTMLAKNQILQQASTAMLAQANASKQNVLSLLQG